MFLAAAGSRTGVPSRGDGNGGQSTSTTERKHIMKSIGKLRSPRLSRGVVAFVAAGGLLMAIAGPAAAATGVQTGWEYAPAGGTGCGLPQSGFQFPTDQFVLTDPVSNASLTINIGPNVAAPQAAAPGTCASAINPVVPSPITITSVYPNATGTAPACTLVGSSNTYSRTNSTITIHFTTTAACAGATTWDITGNQNPCGLIVQFNPECVTDPGFPFGNASSHLVTTYMNS